jgi:hypothetical protein
MATIWKAKQEVVDLLDSVKEKHHLPRLQVASVVAIFSDSKPFIKNRFNWGTVKKFSPFHALWLSQKHTFCITICADLWHDILNANQREALLDLHLTRCEPVFLPETIEENGKKKVVKDDWGRVQFTDQVKLDDEGNPKWQIAPLDVLVLTKNVQRFGLWTEELTEFAKVVKK